MRRRPSPVRRSLALRRRLRHPLPHWLLAAALAVATGLTVSDLTSDARSERARFGRLRPTLVATRPLAAGATLTEHDAEVRLLPAEMVPRAALRAAPRGAVVVAPIHPGEAILPERLAPGPLSPVAARLPPGTRGVAVPLGPGRLPLRIGDGVDVLATFDPATTAGDEGAPPTFAIARGAVVVAVDDEVATVAVPVGDAARVAYALVAGMVTLTLSGAR